MRFLPSVLNILPASYTVKFEVYIVLTGWFLCLEKGNISSKMSEKCCHNTFLSAIYTTTVLPVYL
jgi:hypothetical protein